MEKTRVNITVTPKFRDEVMLFKIKTKAGNMQEVLEKAIKLLKKHESKWRR